MTSLASKKRQRSQLTKWRDMMSNWDQVTARTPQHVQESIRRGIPSQLRGHVWMSLTSATVLKHNHPGLYAQCLTVQGDDDPFETDKRASSSTTTTPTPTTQPATPNRSTTPNNVRETREETISRDIGRTFPKHQQFRDCGGLGQRSLYHVLRAYSILDPAVGYCQGMGYIVALLLTTMCEESAFWTLVSLMQSTKYSMSGLFRTGLPRLQLYQHMLESLLRERQQDTDEHLFDSLGVIPSSFAPQWIMTIFTSSFPLESALRVWDVFLNEGWPYIFQVMMAMMKLASTKLLLMSNFEDALKLLCDDIPRSIPMHVLLENSYALVVTKEDYATLEQSSINVLVEQYGMERNETKLETGTSQSRYSVHVD